MTVFHHEPGDDHDDTVGVVSRRGFAVDPPLLWRGVTLGGLSFVLGRLAFGSLRRSLLLLPFALVFAGGAAIAAWASAIQLTGGVRHDDHPWV